MNKIENADLKETSKISTYLTTVNLIKFIFGFGTFCLPSSFKVIENINAFIAMIISSLILIWSTHELSIIEDAVRKKTKDKTSIFSFSSLVKKVLGNVGKLILQVAILSTVFFISIFYIVSIKTMLSKSYKFMADSKNLESSQSEEIPCPKESIWEKGFIYVVIFSLLFYALTFIKSPKLKALTNIFGMVVVISCMIMLLSVRPKSTDDFKSKYLDFGKFKPTKVLKGIPMCIFLLAVHILAVEFRQEIENPKSFIISNAVSCTFSAILNSIFAAVCVVSFYKENSVNDAIVLNMIKDKKYAKLRFIAALLLSLNLCFSLMMLTGSLVGIVKGFFVRKKKRRSEKGLVSDNRGTEETFFLELIIKSVFLLIVIVLGIFLEDKSLEQLVNVIGAICLPLLGFVMPGVMLIKLFRRRSVFAMGRGIFLVLFGVINSIFKLVEMFLGEKKKGEEK